MFPNKKIPREPVTATPDPSGPFRRVLFRAGRLYRGIAAVFLTAVLAVAALAAFAPRVPDESSRVAEVRDVRGLDEECGPRCASIQVMPDRPEGGTPFSLGFLEFDDFGRLQDEAQLGAVVSHMDARSDDGQLIVLVYVHGWNHDARPADQDVACFAEVTRAVSMQGRASESTNRRVMGVYVGWRGRDFEWDPVNKGLSFLGRLASADRVGSSSDMRRFLIEVAELRAESGKDIKVVIVGHSLGARVAYHAVRPFAEVGALSGRADIGIEALADAVFLVNPALSAVDFLSLGDREKYSLTEDQALFVVASNADGVTGGMYPWAFGLRGWSGNGTDPAVTAVGSYPSAWTDSLVFDGESRNVVGARDTGCARVRAESLGIVEGPGRAVDARSLGDFAEVGVLDERGDSVGVMKLESIKPWGAVRIVSVTESIIPNHNDFFGSEFIEFLVRVANSRMFSFGG